MICNWIAAGSSPSTATLRSLARGHGAAWFVDGVIVQPGDSVTVIVRLQDVLGDSIVARSGRTGPRGASIPLLAARAMGDLLPTLVQPGRPIDVSALRDRNPAAITHFLRADGYYADVRSDTPANSGRATDGIVNPKLGLVLGPWSDTEIYVNYGGGFHSNDARGVTATVDPASPLFNITRSPFLVPSTGYELGLRNRSIAGLETSLALFRLDFASENIFQGDTGTTEPSRPTRRFGVEWTNRYALTPWLALDGDLTITNARFSRYDPAGNRVPEAPTTIASAGVTFGEPLGWFGSLRFRYFGPRPLIEDNSIRSRSTALVNGRIGYAFGNGVSVSLDVLNLTNSRSDQITYAYASRLPGEPAEGLIDRVFHPVEPTAVRLTIAGRF